MTAAAGKRAQIVASAQALIAQRGFAETALGDVAQACGMLKGNLSYYFKTKAELLAAVSEARQAELIAALSLAAVPGRTAAAHARLQLLGFLDHVEAQAEMLALQGCPIGSLCSELGKGDAALLPSASAVLGGLQDWLAAQFGALLGDAGPVAAAHAEQLLAMMQGAALLAQAHREPAVVRRMSAAGRRWLDGLAPA